MNPSACLLEMRRLAARIQEQGSGAFAVETERDARRLADLVLWLDVALETGGVLPDSWRPAALEAVEAGVG